VTGRRAFVRRLSALIAAGGFLPTWETRAQPKPSTRRIAFINVGPAEPNAPNVAAFRESLRELGYVEGRDLTLDFFWGDQQVERLPGLVADLLARKPDVILSCGGPSTIRAVKAATSSIPVVFITGDAVGEGIVASLARPGANLTGFNVFAASLDGKRLEILHEALPAARTVAILWNPGTPGETMGRDDASHAAARLGLEIHWLEARDNAELERALASIPIARTDALFVVADPVLGFRRKRIVEFANANRLPGVYFWREFVEDGGLMSYGARLTDIYRRAARYVDKILNGAKPADLPIEQPTTFELVVNLRTAKAIGVTFPKSLLVRADVVQ
jgi:putative ABC transport system substrate-binding protein